MGEARVGRVLVVDNVPEGVQKVSARKSGHKDWEREVQVAVNQRLDVIIDIEPLGPGKVINGDDGAEMVLVAAGEFWMGSHDAEVQRAVEPCTKAAQPENMCKEWASRESPRHRLTLAAFYIDRFEATNALFERFVRATGHRTTAEREGDGWVRQQKDGT